jgi:hypothetical protein
MFFLWPTRHERGCTEEGIFTSEFIHTVERTSESSFYEHGFQVRGVTSATLMRVTFLLGQGGNENLMPSNSCTLTSRMGTTRKHRATIRSAYPEP